MTEDHSHIFISYARQDGSACAKRVSTLLVENGFCLWQDRTHMRGGKSFWRQIEDAIDRCSHVVMIVSPSAAQPEREILRREWDVARKAGKWVVPVKSKPNLDLSDGSFPEWLTRRHIFDIDHTEEKEAFLGQLRDNAAVERVPFMAATLPEYFTPRPTETAELQRLVFAGERSGALCPTVALQGAPGFGKTTLATALCHDDQVINEFDDGILWVTLGEQPSLSEKLAALYAALTNERPVFQNEDDAAKELADRLRFKRCLLVIDDVWDHDHLRFFLRGARQCVRLVTTRQSSIVAMAKAPSVRVDEMKTEEAAQMLIASLPSDAVSTSGARRVVQRLGEWPILVNLFGGHVRESMEAFNQPADAAIAGLLRILDSAKVTSLDRESSSDRAAAIEATLGASMDRMPAVESRNCAALAVFPEDVAVPVAVVGQLWGLSRDESEMSLRRMANLGMIRLDLGAETVQLHDVIREYLGDRLEQPERKHADLLAAWGDLSQLDSPYAWRWVAYHLVAADRSSDLNYLLTDFDWLRKKVENTDIGALIEDFDRPPDAQDLQVIRDAIMGGLHWLVRDLSQLPGQLLARLPAGVSPDADRLLATAHRWRGHAWLRPLIPSLSYADNRLLRVIRGYADGHEGTVRSIAIDRMGTWAVTAGNSHPDQSLIVWGLRTGRYKKIPGQAAPGGHTPLTIADDAGVFLSGYNEEIRVFDLVDGELLDAWAGGGGVVSAIAVTTDGRFAVTGGENGDVRLWDLDNREPQKLGRHERNIDAVAISADGSWAAAASRDELWLWTPGSGDPVAKLTDATHLQTNFARCFDVSATDGRVFWPGPEVLEASEGSLSTWGHPRVRSWRPPESEPRVETEKPTNGILAVNAERRLALTLAEDDENRLAKVGFGHRFVFEVFPPVGRGISTAAVSGDGRWAVSADYEHDLFVWDLAEDFRPIPLKQVPSWWGAKFAGLSADGRFAIFEGDGQHNVFDLHAERGAAAGEDGAPEPATLADSIQVHADEADSRQGFSGSALKIADTSGIVGNQERERGHTAAIVDSATSPDGRWDATVSVDGTVRIWDMAENRTIAVFAGDSELQACQWSPDSRTLAVDGGWNGTHLLRLEGVAEDDERG